FGQRQSRCLMRAWGIAPGIRLPVVMKRRKRESVYSDKVRDGGDATASTQDACAPRTCTLHCSMFLQHLDCSACGRQHQWSRLQNLCLSCQKPLLAIVDLTAAGRTLTRESVATREK